MLRLFKILFILLLALSFETGEAQNPLWTDGSAFTVPHKTLEVCLFRPAKYGLTKNSELSAHPVAFFALPHLFLKQKWTKFDVWIWTFYLSTRHGLYYPSLVLKKANILKSDMLLSPLFENTSVIAFQNELIISHLMDKQTHCTVADRMITGRLGLKYAFKSNDVATPVVLQSIFYRETMVFTPQYIWYAGLRFDAHLNMIFNYFADLNFYSVGFKTDYYSVESKAGIMGYSGRYLKGFAGIKTGFSTMPDKNRFLIMPIAGVSYTFSRKSKKKKELGLFRRKIFEYQDTSLDKDIEYMDKDWREKKDSIPVDNTDPDFK